MMNTSQYQLFSKYCDIENAKLNLSSAITHHSYNQISLWILANTQPSQTSQFSHPNQL